MRGRAQEEALKSEINVHRKLRHRHVVRLFSYYVTKESVVLVLEKCSGGTLLQLLRKSPDGCLSESVVRRVVRHVAEALKYLHQQGVVHRDLKPANVLISVDGQVKLADFGTAFDLSMLTPND